MSRSKLPPTTRWFAAVLLAALLGGCTQAGYYAQAMRGQWEILRHRQDIAPLLADPATPASLRARLELVAEVRAFATNELGLPDNGSYHSYLPLDRDYVLWNVFAAPEFALELKQWCFPVAGCVAYRGYFAEAQARAFADGLREQGFDVAVGGVPAYSTLGWFADPVPSTVLNWSDAALAGLIMHELAHQQLYVQDDSAFNESFAVAVEREGVRRWLQARGETEAWAAYQDRATRREEVLLRVARTRLKLTGLYGSIADEEHKRRAKQIALEELRHEIAALGQRWGEPDLVQRWFGDDLNNARLGALETYEMWVPAFTKLLHDHNNDLVAFYAAARELADLNPDARREKLRELRG